MRYRVLTAFGAIGLCALAGSSSLQSAGAGGQAGATPAASAWTAPKTSWGHPDLQGIWTTDQEIGVPLERPVELGDKATLTEAEYRQRTEMLKKRYNDEKASRVGEIGNEQGPVH